MIRRIALTLVFILVLCEVGLRMTLPQPPARPTPPVSLTYSDHYDRSPYWSSSFAMGFSTIYEGETLNDDWVMHIGTSHATGYTIINDERLTTDRPQQVTRDVWIYGSSTVFGAFVADGWTIPSYLQRTLNSRGVRWRVHNMGQPAITSTLEVYWLNRTEVAPGDLVIFLDGGAEYNQLIGRALQDWRDTSVLCYVGRYSLIAKLLCEQQMPDPPPQSYVAARAKLEFPDYWQDIEHARQIALNRHAVFYHFIQPTGRPYPAVYRTIARGDTLFTLDARYFFDVVHYDDTGNQLIARQIADAIAPQF